MLVYYGSYSLLTPAELDGYSTSQSDITYELFYNISL